MHHFLTKLLRVKFLKMNYFNLVPVPIFLQKSTGTDDSTTMKKKSDVRLFSHSVGLIFTRIT